MASEKSDGAWTDVAPVFRELASVAVKRSIMGYVNQLDLLNVFKSKNDDDGK